MDKYREVLSPGPEETDSTFGMERGRVVAMFWRVAHDTLKWFWPALFGACVGVAGIAIAASQEWPEAKEWTASRFSELLAVLNQPIFWAFAALVFAIWLAAFIWSGHMSSATAPAQAAGGPSVDEWIESYKPPPKRDATLIDGLIYSLTGRWGDDVSYALDTVEQIEALTFRLREFEQAARDGDLTVWGREQVMGMTFADIWDLIEPDHWKRNRVYWFSLVQGDNARTEPRLHQTDDQFDRLMVSRTEFEGWWQHEQA